MARRGCVNSLWSGTERVRIGERLKATLAGVLELEVLRCKHLEMVDAALEDRASCDSVSAANADEPQAAEEDGSGTPESAACMDAEHGSATSRRQQAPSPSDIVVLPCQSSPEDSVSSSGDGMVHSSSGRGSNSRWSTLSWDAPSDLLSPPTLDPSGTVHLESDSRPSSGFYSVSGSSLSDSCYSVSSDAAQGGSAPPARPLKLWEQAPLSAENTDILWSEGAMQQQQQQQQQPALQNKPEDSEPTEGTSVSVQNDLEATGLSFLSDLCLSLGDSLISSLLPLLDPTSSSSTASLHPKPQLDSRYCTDLVSRRTKEVYPYPSPLHAVALQSPLFTSQSQEQSASPSPEGTQLDEESNNDPTLPLQPQQPASFTQLEQYISRLARQYHSRVSSSTSDLTSAATHIPVTHRGLCTPGKSHGSTQSLSAFESRSALSITPCKSLLGNSARVSLSTTGKKATRNSINLGNLPSATGEDLNINLHLNLNLNLTPGLNSSRGLVDNPKNGSSGSLKSDFAAPSTVSATSFSSTTPTPAVRTRPRISTCPSSLSHRSSLEVSSGSVPSSGFGSSAFCRSLDWSSGAPPETGSSVFGTNSGSAPGSQRSSLIQESSSSPKLSEDSPMVGEISRLSGLSRAVVVGLMEQGVELDIDCFQTDPAGEPPLLPPAPTPRGHSPPRPLQPSPLGGTPLSVFRRDAPFQCSLPRTNTRSSPLEHGGILPRGGSLRQSGGGNGGTSGWKRAEGEGLYKGKHASHKLIRAATVSSYAKRENYSSVWGQEQERSAAQTQRKSSNKLWKGFEGRLWGKESENEREEMDRAEYGYSWRRNSIGSWRREHRRSKASSSNNDKKPKVENSPIFSKKRGKKKGRDAAPASGFPGGPCSGSLEGSCHSISPLSSPSFSPSPPPRMPLQRSRSLRDLGRRVFGSMRSLSLKRKPSKK
ncbi:Dapper-like protein 2 Frodo 2 [Larimichthys crocea]|uniref:Dapper-like protein 2 Frodo 2 n=1 Tax=Larimichthys crocea TaxID=215358 RepID=A0A6G0I3M2_LARCR|nr:Dapper-like protein 2 Frodo 2 [Larimichthys crocea]